MRGRDKAVLVPHAEAEACDYHIINPSKRQGSLTTGLSAERKLLARRQRLPIPPAYHVPRMHFSSSL